jgi:AcrR family transcriptional regulator
MSAEERRESVIRAAMSEFARGGYHGTSTEAIARRVGVSQPYLFRLFKNKRELFLAAAERCIRQTVDTFTEALENRPAVPPKEAMADAYAELIDDRERLLMQMQMYVAVATAEASGDHEFGELIRDRWAGIWDRAGAALGGGSRDVTDFLAHGMLINTLVCLGFPMDHRVWSGFALSPCDDSGPAGEPDPARPVG